MSGIGTKKFLLICSRRRVRRGDEKADDEKKLVNRVANKVLRQKKAKGEDADTGVVAADESPAAGGEG